MATTTTTTNKPLNPRAQDLSPKGYNRAALYSGKALSFDGVNDTITGSSAALPASDYTIAAWFNLDTLKASGIVVWGDEANFERRALFVWDAGSGGGTYYLYSSTYASNVAATTQLSAGRWYFGVITLTAAGAAKIYLNGREDGSGTNTLAAYTGTQYKVGNTGSSEFTNGKIAGARVFNQVLTPAQVSDLYLNPEKIVPDGVASSALKLWLPMMEGAGASAYDGSGNGNDGTINGATWTAGIGAPVAQTALVSWNKGSNLFNYSEQFDNAAWTNASTTITANDTTSPSGAQDADKITATAPSQLLSQSPTLTIGQPFALSVFVKAGNWGIVRIGNQASATNGAWFNVNTGTAGTINGGTSEIIDYGNGWYRLIAKFSSFVSGQCFIGISDADGSTTTAPAGSFMYLWGAQITPTTTAQPYIKTNATAQTSAVLVPEGLTAGASIFGTDIITPRNAFALNLDGASWGKVGRNTSVNPTTAITLEAWIKKSTKSGFHHILSRNAVADYYYSMFTEDATGALCFQGTTSATYKTSGVDVCTGSWVHVLVAYNTTQALFYVNGVLVSTNALTDALTPNSVDLFIGARPSGIQLYDAQLANPRIYNRALTAAEVLRNYNADKAKFGL
jgi:hypothetical protein